MNYDNYLLLLTLLLTMLLQNFIPEYILKNYIQSKIFLTKKYVLLHGKQSTFKSAFKIKFCIHHFNLRVNYVIPNNAKNVLYYLFSNFIFHLNVTRLIFWFIILLYFFFQKTFFILKVIYGLNLNLCIFVV